MKHKNNSKKQERKTIKKQPRTSCKKQGVSHPPPTISAATQPRWHAMTHGSGTRCHRPPTQRHIHIWTFFPDMGELEWVPEHPAKPRHFEMLHTSRHDCVLVRSALFCLRLVCFGLVSCCSLPFSSLLFSSLPFPFSPLLFSSLLFSSLFSSRLFSSIPSYSILFSSLLLTY